VAKITRKYMSQFLSYARFIFFFFGLFNIISFKVNCVATTDKKFKASAEIMFCFL